MFSVQRRVTIHIYIESCCTPETNIMFYVKEQKKVEEGCSVWPVLHGLQCLGSGAERS